MTHETFTNNFDGAEQGTFALLVSRYGLVVALKIDINAVRNGDVGNMSCIPSVYSKGTGWQGRQLKDLAFQKGIPVCECEYTALRNIFDNVGLGAELSFEQFKEIYPPLSHRDVLDSFMNSKRFLRKPIEVQKQRIIRRGGMYKLFVESWAQFTGYDTFILYSGSGDEAAIQSAYSWARLKDHRPLLSYRTELENACPDYTFPFKLFCVSADGQDRLVYQYAPPQNQKSPWKVYVLIGCQKDYNNTKCFYSKNDETAILEAHQHVRNHLIKHEYREQVPEEYAPCSYQIFYDGKLIYEYFPSQEITVNPEYLNENRYGNP